MATPALAALSPVDLLAHAIRHFVSSCREPHILERGHPSIGLSGKENSFAQWGSYPQQDSSAAVAAEPCNWKLDRSASWLLLEAWDRETFLSRKILSIKGQAPGRLELITHRLGGKAGSIVLYDAFRPGNAGIAQKGRRLVFAQRFRHFMQREFPGARMERFHTDADLEHSLSPAYPRALLRHEGARFAAIAAPPASDVDGVLSFGLIWLDYLRHTVRGPIGGLVLFLPQGRETTTCLRVLHLNPARAAYRVFGYDNADYTIACDPADCGNLDTHLPAVPSAECEARLEPEALIEQQTRSQMETLDARLRPDPVYGQVPNFSGADRGILDLLAIDFTGRLAVVELKATESVHLPLQALDYWLRVKWHLAQNDFSRHGYFPGLALRADAPRLLLAAPALRFHPTNERILTYFQPDIEVQRIGLAEGPGALRVLFRY